MGVCVCLLQFEPERMSTQIVARILVKVCLIDSALTLFLTFTFSYLFPNTNILLLFFFFFGFLIFC